MQDEAVSQTPLAVTPLDAADITLRDDEALRALLARVTEQARLKKLDRATLTRRENSPKRFTPTAAGDGICVVIDRSGT